MRCPKPGSPVATDDVFEAEVLALEAQMARTRSAKKRATLANQGCALLAAWTLHGLILDIRKEVSRERMTEHRRREPEVDLLLETLVNVAFSFPDEFLHKATATRFFELLGDVARNILSGTTEFHPVIFRQALNDGWCNLGRAQEVAYAMERAHETGSKGGTEGTSISTTELRKALLEGTITGTIEEIAEQRFMSTRNVDFAKAYVRRRQAD